MRTKIIFFLLLIFVIGAGNANAEEQTLTWQETPGSQREKQQSMETPGTWIRIADSQRTTSQRNSWGVREVGIETFIRMISYDKKKKIFYLIEGKSSFQEDRDQKVMSWLIPIIAPFFIMWGWIFAMGLFARNNVPIGTFITVSAFLTHVLIAWYYNYILLILDIGIIVIIIYPYISKKVRQEIWETEHYCSPRLKG